MTIHDLERLFQPRSIAVIGATANPGRAGAMVMRNLSRGGFDGPIMPVNPGRTHVAGILCYPDVASLPLVPDLAVICSPSHTVAEQILALGRRGGRAAISITGGYSHSYLSNGPDLLEGIRSAAREAGVRLLGPNCLGLVVPSRRLNASFAHVDALPGKLGFVARSAGITTTVLDWARPRNIGFSVCVSLGDCADIGYDDAIDYLAQDPGTRAILLFLEDMTERGAMLSAVRAAARTKPVLCIKRPHIVPRCGRPTSLTAALTSPDDVADAALRRAGVLRVSYLEEMFGAVDTLANAKPLHHERLTILTNSATLATIATDEILSSHGELTTLAPATLDKLNAALPFAWSRTNPVDILIDADGDRYAAALRILLEDPDIDRILVIHAPTGIVSPEDTAIAVIGTIGRLGGNVIASWVGEETAASARRLFARAGIPTHDTPARAARAFLHVVHHRRNQAMLIETPPAIAADFVADKASARAVVANLLADGREIASPAETAAILAAYGIRSAESAPGSSVAVHRQLIMGITTDTVFGPVILFGEGGEAAAVLRDTAIALPPLNPPLARELMSRTRISRKLATGSDGPNTSLAVKRALIHLAQMAIDLPEIVDLDINPLEVEGGHLRALGAFLRLAPVTAEARRRPAIRPYPGDLEENLTLRDGRTVLARPIRPEDEPAHHVFISRLSPEDIRFRFFGFIRGLEHTQMARLTQIDYDREMAFIAAAIGADGELETLGIVRTITDPDNRVAEFSMIVRSDLKGQGLGRQLLEKMIRYCESRGTGEIKGQILPDNSTMLRLMRKMGFRVAMVPEDEVVEAKKALRASGPPRSETPPTP
ncbi:MAG: bifunctional acetate--CoA ligase family protein/GNAT family N-acetyltransferase [Rhodospirillaceae bacterium]